VRVLGAFPDEEAMAVRLARIFTRKVVLFGVLGLVAVLALGLAVSVGGQRGGSGESSSVAVPALPRPVPRPDVAGAPGNESGGKAAPAIPPVEQVGRQLVRTAQLTVEVDDAARATRAVRTAAAGAGAIVTQEQSGDSGSWMVLRVPADSLDRLIEDLAALGKVTGRSSQVVDATERVVDLDARVASQKASVDRVRDLLTKAQSIGDVVAIESELARREADLDSLTSRLTALRDQVAMSTLTVDLRGPSLAPPPADRAGGFLGGLSAGWEGLLALGTVVAAVVGFLLPFLPVVALLVGIGWMVRRIVRMRRTPAPAGAGGRSGPGSEGES
jgi:uncharacterized coiled-coil protein SlyX